jgi:hypothetical protein
MLVYGYLRLSLYFGAMAIDQAVLRWDGFPGAPGYSVFYADPGNDVLADIWAFFDNWRTALPADVHITMPTEGLTYDEVTGTVTGTWTRAALGTVNGGDSGVYPAPTGACVTWRTGEVANGRLVRGRTFLVPLGGSSYQNDGSIGTEILAAIRNAANSLVSNAGGHLLVWHRPVGGAGGSKHPVVAATVADRAAVLKSRRQ